MKFLFVSKLGKTTDQIGTNSNQVNESRDLVWKNNLCFSHFSLLSFFLFFFFKSELWCVFTRFSFLEVI